jgi:hypothetical protein
MFDTSDRILFLAKKVEGELRCSLLVTYIFRQTDWLYVCVSKICSGTNVLIFTLITVVNKILVIIHPKLYRGIWQRYF